MTKDTTHDAAHILHFQTLQDHVRNETARLAQAKGAGEIALRTVWLGQAEKELSDHIAFMRARGLHLIPQAFPAEVDSMSVDELAAELEG